MLKSASSSTMVADFPPNSRNSRFMVAAPFSMIRLPTAVDPVNEIMSTLGEIVSSSPTKWSDAVTTFTTPRRDIRLLGDEPAEPGGVERCVRRGLEYHGVSGRQGLPQLVDGDLEREVPRCDGADHADGSCHTFRVVFTPPVTDTTVSPRSVSQAKVSISLAGYRSPSSSGASNCGPWVTARGAPTSRISSSRNSSTSPTIAS